MIELVMLVILLVFLLIVMWLERALAEAVNDGNEDFRKFDEQSSSLLREGSTAAVSNSTDINNYYNKNSSQRKSSVKIPIKCTSAYAKPRGEVNQSSIAH